jgi:hypothetical protein
MLMRAYRLNHSQWSRMVAGEGFEPSKSMTADLQSAPFGRSGTPPGVLHFVGFLTRLLRLEAGRIISNEAPL